MQRRVMCTAIYVSDYLQIDDQLAHISPCVASKYEIDEVEYDGASTQARAWLAQLPH